MAKDNKKANNTIVSNSSTSSIMGDLALSLEKGGAAAATEVVTYPFTVWSKKRESGLFDKPKNASIANKATPFSFDTAKKLVAESYKGFNINMAKTAVQVPLQFIAQEKMKDYLKTKMNTKDDKAMNALISGIAGAGSGAFTTVVTYPADTVITQVATNTFDKQNILQSKKSLYNGLNPALLRSTLGLSITFPVYDLVKQKIAKDPNNPSIAETFFASSVGGICGQLGTNPIDVIKTRKQIAKPTPGQVMQNTMQIAKDIYAKEGLSGFYRGGFYNSGKMVAKFGPRATLFVAAPKIVENVTELGSAVVDKVSNMFKYFQPKPIQQLEQAQNKESRPTYK